MHRHVKHQQAMHCASRCHIGCEEEKQNDTEDVGDVFYVESKVVSQERVNQGFNHGKPKIDDKKCTDNICNGLWRSHVKAVTLNIRAPK